MGGVNGHIEPRVSPRTGRKTWRVRVFLGKHEGGPRWASGGTYKRLRAYGDEPCAETALDGLLTQLRSDSEKGVTTDETVTELLERWMRDAVRPDKRPKTVQAHDEAVRLHLAPRLGQVPAQALTPADVASWQAAQIAAGFSAKSVRNWRGSLSACYAWALRLGLVATNPVPAVPPPRLPEHHVEAMDLGDAQRYLDALRDTRLWPALMLAATTGARRAEVLALRWCDVDLDAGKARIHRQLVGRNQRTLTSGPLKTAKSRRTISLPIMAVASLQELRRERAALLAPGQAFDAESLICCGRRGQPIVPDRLTSELNLRLRRRGMEPVSIHKFRHMVATTLLRAGVPVKVVSEHLGHSQVTTTLLVYDHVSERDDEAAAGTLQRAWEEAARAAGGQDVSQIKPAAGTVDDLGARRRRKQALS